MSERERTVLLLAADGLTDKEIAQNLGLSLKTIHTYWDRMRQKFSASTRTEVFAKFLRISVDGPGENEGFRRLFSTWEEGVWIFSPKGKTIYANPRLATTFGITVDELFDMTPQKVFAKVQAKEFGTTLEKMQREAVVTDLPIEPSRGTRHWLQLKGTPIMDEKGECRAVVLLVQDITVQRRVERTLDSCARMLEWMTGLTTDHVAKFDRDLVCQYLNPALLRTIDGLKDPVIGQKIHSLDHVFPPCKVWAEAIERAFQSGERQQFTTTPMGEVEAIHVWVLPEPSTDFDPPMVYTISRIAEE